MIYKEYGTGSSTIILLHGGGLSWWNYREEAELLQNEYHIILPVLDGHAASDRPFTTIEDNAAELIAFIDEHFNGSVLLIGGLSLGAQILLEVLSQRRDICRYALVESAAVLPSKLTNALIGPAFGSSYGLIKNRSFARLQAESLHIRPELFEDYYRDTCLITRPDMIAFMKANTAYSLKDSIRESTAGIHLYVGEKETGVIRKSVEQIHAVLPDSTVQILPGLYHGEFSLNHPEDYVRAVREILEN
ncbi:MAG: alpha/beta hydrolase [Solobacterium sp.]|nr:alpha/beta hydrolase [Solobacterium sp.]MBR0477665.1 alpha/beta hydrolase [Solobacterium sp.]